MEHLLMSCIVCVPVSNVLLKAIVLSNILLISVTLPYPVEIPAELTIANYDERLGLGQ